MTHPTTIETLEALPPNSAALATSGPMPPNSTSRDRVDPLPENSAALEAIVLRAERRIGEELVGMVTKYHGNRHSRKSGDGTSLDDLGFTKNQSSRYQAEARVPRRPTLDPAAESSGAAGAGVDRLPPHPAAVPGHDQAASLASPTSFA